MQIAGMPDNTIAVAIRLENQFHIPTLGFEAKPARRDKRHSIASLSENKLNILVRLAILRDPMPKMVPGSIAHASFITFSTRQSSLWTNFGDGPKGGNSCRI